MAIRNELRPDVYFINILWTAFIRSDPKSEKRQSSQQCIFATARETLTKLITDVNFININMCVGHQSTKRY